jgi:putative transposase
VAWVKDIWGCVRGQCLARDRYADAATAVTEQVAQALLPVQISAMASKPAQSGVTVLQRAVTYYARNLPHWHPEGKCIFITWRLYGSLPQAALDNLEKLRSDPGRQFLTADRLLDAGSFGPTWLQDPKIAELVVRAIRRGEELRQYDLHAYTVMPNHVHLLIDPFLSLSRIMRGLKGTSASDANAALNRIGQRFWQDESFDHWIRGAAQFERIRAYIEQNPVRAGLIMKADQWQWSSACK